MLRGYNITADGGKEGSRIFKNNGLVYRILNDKGEKIGVPIKASAIYNNPGMKMLTQKFSQSKPLKEPHSDHVKNAIDRYFVKNARPSLPALMTALQKEKIQVVRRQNENGVIYGMTYVDHHTKCVFNGSELGKQYSSNAIQRRCDLLQTTVDAHELKQQHVETQNTNKEPFFTNKMEPTPERIEPGKSSLLKDLVTGQKEGTLAGELQEEKKRARKRKLRNS